MSDVREEDLPTPPELIDPVIEAEGFSNTQSKIAIASHPIHAMMVAFPISAAFGTLGADIVYWWTGDQFWFRAGLWASGVGFLIGVLAGVVGTLELLLVPGIRVRAASWTHFVIAMTLLSVMAANWGLRYGGGEAAILPYGLLVSLLVAAMTGFTGWHGGKLVFDYQIGTLRGTGKSRP